MTQHSRPKWSSTLGFIFATTGAAVGLGNIWRFPYEAGRHGGSAFVLVYIVATLLISIPLMMSEMLLGRIAKSNPVDALQTLAATNKRSQYWQALGWWGLVCLFIILAFYCVVGSWGMAYLWALLAGKLQSNSAVFFQNHWAEFTQNWPEMIFCNTIFLTLTLWVVAQGIQKGLERASKIMMPLLFMLLLILAFWGTQQKGYAEAMRFLFAFDLHKIDGNVLIFALGQAFFSAAIGAGCLLAYGSYLPTQTAIPRSVGIITFCNVMVALLSGLAIFPILFSEHIAPTQGPGLMFIALPAALMHIPYGPILSAIFFVLLIFAAWTSSISLAEPLVMLFCERLNVARWKVTVYLGFAVWILGLVSIFSFNIWQHITLFGHTIFSAMTDMTTNIMLPLGGLGFTCFTAWCIPSHKIKASLPLKNETAAKYFSAWLRYGATGLLILVILNPIIVG
jgi:neurotransmitter:Na+ symporter, NSS family